MRAAYGDPLVALALTMIPALAQAALSACDVTRTVTVASPVIG
jgi:hypothetical protein